MMPFRELENFDAFMLNGQECDKVGTDKYLIYDEQGEPESLQVADPNMMVELMDVMAELLEERGEKDDSVEKQNDFFRYLLYLIDELGENGDEELTIESLKKFAEDFLAMPEDD